VFKVRTPRGNEYAPDVVVVCGPRTPNGARYTESPCLVVEVLSPSTARTDLSEKRLAYQEIGTVGAYLVVEAEWRGVHRHWRDPAGAWRLETVTGDGAISLPCPAGEVLTLAEVYADLDLPAGPPPVPRLRRVRERPPEGAAV
jgi:Uma2 family endonuclease